MLTSFLLAFVLAESVMTGDLPRQADLGFGTEESERAIVVRALREGSEASAAGVREGDVVVAVNGRTFEKPYVGQDLLRRLDGGKRVALSLRREGESLAVQGVPTPRALENLEGVTTTYGVIEVPDGSHLRTLVTRPRGILFQTEYLLRRKSPEQIEREYPELAGVFAEILGSGDGVHYGRPYAYHQQAAARNFLEAWAGIEAPVLVVYGEYDQFETRHGHELIAHTMNGLRPGAARFVSIDHMDHDYGVYATAEDAYTWTYGPSAPGHDAPELFVGEILRWLRDVGLD